MSEKDEREHLLGKIAALRIFTTEINAALSFYRGALGFVPHVSYEDVAVFKIGSYDLILEAMDRANRETATLVGSFVGASLEVADLYEADAEMAARGLRFDGEPAVQDWGDTIAHFFDPNGNVPILLSYAA